MPTDLQGRSSTAGPHEDASPDRWAWRWFVPTCFAGTVLFSLSVTQAPLYSGNQVTKFLHGFAQANAGTLDTDWLVSTSDPLPVFSSLVYLTLEWTSPRLFYLEFALLQAVYLAGLFGIALYRFQCTPTRGRLLIWFTALTVLHSRVFQELGWLLINKRFFSPFTTGLAQQYILEDYLQPAAFGAFILFSVALFLHDRWFLAVLALGISTAFHSAYLLPAGLFTAAYMVVSIQRGYGARRAILIGTLALGTVLPVVLYNLIALAPSSSETWMRAVERLVNERIPHHSLWFVWLTPSAYLKLILMSVGLLVAGRRVIGVLIVPFLGGLGLTLAQIASDHTPLALIAPWRVSVVLVPIASILLVGHVTERLSLDRLKIVRISCWVVLAVCVVSGTFFQRSYFNARDARPEAGVMAYVREHATPSDVYLVHPSRAGFSGFRIAATAPVVATWKSHPYRDQDLLEWFDRLKRIERFFAVPSPERWQELEGLVAKFGVTHVVVDHSTGNGQPPERMERLYADDSYVLYRVPLPADQATYAGPWDPRTYRGALLHE